MYRTPNLQLFLSLLLAMALTMYPLLPRAIAAPQESARGSDDLHRDDPCTHLPNPPGKANGIEKQCPAASSSSGIAKGDFNGDGFADLAIGEPGASIGGQSGAGDVIILFGGPNGLTTTGREDWDLSKIRDPYSEFDNLAPAAGDNFGTALASGDFNGDGFSDLAIGIPGRTSTDPSPFFPPHKQAGAVVVLYGSANGLTTNVLDPGLNYCDLRCAASSAYKSSFSFDGARFGQSLAWGNFNGDKSNGNDIGDLAVGIPGASTEVFGINVLSNDGAVLVVPGSQTSGLGDFWQLTDVLLTEFGSLGLGDHSFDEFGSALTGGDFNGDGFTDLAIGARGFPGVGGQFAGIVGVVYGSKAGLNPFGTPAAQVWAAANLGSNSDSGDEFGAALAAGDFNGDGKADLVVGAPGKDVVAAEAGVVFVLAGSGSGLTSTGHQIWDQEVLGRGVQGAARFGSALAAGDFSGDGLVDLAIGVPFRTVGGFANAGEVDIIYGSSPAGLSTTAVRGPQFWTQDTALGSGNTQAGNRFGSSLTAWNFGRNELQTVTTVFGTTFTFLKTTADLAIGAPFQSVNGVSGAGAVDVLYGSFASNGLVNTHPNIFNANNTNIGGAQAGAHFGFAVY